MKQTAAKASPARHISFTEDTLARLEAYLKQHFSGHHALSMVVDRAVVEYLSRHKEDGRI